MTALRAHPFPGNVRELENVLARSLVLSPGKTLVLHDLTPVDAPGRSEGSLADSSRRAIVAALGCSAGKIYGRDGAAARLGVPPSTLQSTKRLGIAARTLSR
jgi:formate hydrogenlyase transcriptional activator